MKKIAALCIGVGCMLTVTGCGSNVTLNTEHPQYIPIPYHFVLYLMLH